VTLNLLLRRLVILDGLFLQIDGTGDVCDTAERQGCAAAGIDEGADVTGAEDLLVIDGDVLEQRQQVNFLLIAGADQIVIGLARQGEDRCPVHLRVVQSVQQMDGARA
jgi:hypothetical protein